MAEDKPETAVGRRAVTTGVDYLGALLFHWHNLYVGVGCALLFVALVDRYSELSVWVIVGIVAGAALIVAQFLAWRDMRGQRDRVAGERDALWTRLNPQLSIRCGTGPGFAFKEMRVTPKDLEIHMDQPGDWTVPAMADCQMTTIEIGNDSDRPARRVRVSIVAPELSSPRHFDLLWLHVSDQETAEVTDIPPKDSRHAILSQHWLWSSKDDPPEDRFLTGWPLGMFLGRDTLVLDVKAWPEDGPSVTQRVRLTGLTDPWGMARCEQVPRISTDQR